MPTSTYPFLLKMRREAGAVGTLPSVFPVAGQGLKKVRFQGSQGGGPSSSGPAVLGRGLWPGPLGSACRHSRCRGPRGNTVVAQGRGSWVRPPSAGVGVMEGPWSTEGGGRGRVREPEAALKAAEVNCVAGRTDGGQRRRAGAAAVGRDRSVSAASFSGFPFPASAETAPAGPTNQRPAACPQPLPPGAPASRARPNLPPRPPSPARGGAAAPILGGGQPFFGPLLVHSDGVGPPPPRRQRRGCGPAAPRPGSGSPRSGFCRLDSPARPGPMVSPDAARAGARRGGAAGA